MTSESTRSPQVVGIRERAAAAVFHAHEEWNSVERSDSPDGYDYFVGDRVISALTTDRATPQPVGEMNEHVFAVGDRVLCLGDIGTITKVWEREHPFDDRLYDVRCDDQSLYQGWPEYDIELIPATPEGGSHDSEYSTYLERSAP